MIVDDFWVQIIQNTGISKTSKHGIFTGKTRRVWAMHMRRLMDKNKHGSEVTEDVHVTLHIWI